MIHAQMLGQMGREKALHLEGCSAPLSTSSEAGNLWARIMKYDIIASLSVHNAACNDVICREIWHHWSMTSLKYDIIACHSSTIRRSSLYNSLKIGLERAWQAATVRQAHMPKWTATGETSNGVCACQTSSSISKIVTWQRSWSSSSSSSSSSSFVCVLSPAAEASPSEQDHSKHMLCSK